MRIAHINLASGFRGGERQTELLIRGLADCGVKQKLIARADESLADRCVAIPGLEIVAASASVISAARALSEISLIHVHQGRSLRAAALNYMFRATPYLVTRRVQKGPRLTSINRFMYQRAAAIVVVSDAIDESIRKLDSSLETIVIPDASSEFAVDQGRARAIRSRFGAKFLVGHVGALDDSHKGQLQIIELAKKMATREPGIQFLLVGSGRDESWLKAAANNLPNVEFTGQVDNVGDYLAAFDVFIFPSRHEGLGSILLDALAEGLPVVATRVGGIPEVIKDSVSGYLCAVDDIESMSTAILRLFGSSQLRARISSDNRNMAKYYAPQEMVRRYLELYKQLDKRRQTEIKEQ
jgi:glycosyltransferase involved in cell wall biosynthesis